MKYFWYIVSAIVIAFPIQSLASLENQVRRDLEGMIRMVFVSTEFDTKMLDRILDEGVEEIKRTKPWLLFEPDAKYPLTTDEFERSYGAFMTLPKKDRSEDILTYYSRRKEKNDLNEEQRILFYRLMQYQLAIKAERPKKDEKKKAEPGATAQRL